MKEEEDGNEKNQLAYKGHPNSMQNIEKIETIKHVKSKKHEKNKK